MIRDVMNFSLCHYHAHADRPLQLYVLLSCLILLKSTALAAKRLIGSLTSFQTADNIIIFKRGDAGASAIAFTELLIEKE